MNIQKNKVIDFLSEEFYELIASLEAYANSEITNLLFFSPEDSAKQMAIDILQERLRRRVYSVDLNVITSKYIGETEKNLDKIFSKADVSDSILFFDEADSLFGKDKKNKLSIEGQKYLLSKLEQNSRVIIFVIYKSENLELLESKFNVIIRFPYFTTIIRKLFSKFKQKKYFVEGKLKPAAETKIGLSSYNSQAETISSDLDK